MKLGKVVAGGLVGAAMLAMSGMANAALVSCDASGGTNLTGKVTSGGNVAVSACQFLTPPDQSNVASISNINAAGFFGHSDWESNGQNQMDDDNSPPGSEGPNGTWSIANVDFTDYDYIIVFKDGSDTNLLAMQFNELYSFGNWSTPFTDPPFDFKNAKGKGPDSKNVSHITIARRLNAPPPPPTDVPEPASLALLGMGLLGMGFAARRRRG